MRILANNFLKITIMRREGPLRSTVARRFFLLALFASPADAQTVNEVVLRPASSATRQGNWVVVQDATAAGGARLYNPNAGLAKVAAVAAPIDYFEMTFTAEAAKAYRLWIRARADSNNWANDSVSVQFSGSVTASGAPVFRIGTTSATVYTLEDCTNCGVAGWGWQDNGYGAGVLGPLIYFQATGTQTIRVQRREDGISIDQIVLSAQQFITSAPGALKNDSTILDVSGGGGGETPGTLPAGWQSQDIGPVGVPGSASEMSGTFTVNGAGEHLWGTEDAFHFAFRSLTGDGTIVAQVTSVQGAQAWTKVGVMMRASTASNSAHGLMLVSTARGVAFQRRTVTGGVSTNTGLPGTAPKWVRLTRAGTVITASISNDGGAWTVVGSDTFADMPATILVGLAVHSQSTTRLATGTFANVSVTTAQVGPRSTLQVAPNLRFLRDSNNGRPVFYFADTPWGIFCRLNRADADFYLDDVVKKGFNAIQAVAVWRTSCYGTRGNAYGDFPFAKNGSLFDPARILTTPGNDPADAVAYDYWDHVDYIIDRAAQKGLYVALEPTWGEHVSGTNSFATNMSSNIFTSATARSYGEFIGKRYANRPNIIWMLGGDRSAIYSLGDFRPVWRALAEGIGTGVTGRPLVWNQADSGWSQLLMTYHATRRDDPGSSIWFHDDAWLSFNGTQVEYYEILQNLLTDWNRQPTKPALVLEGRYEDEPSTDNILFVGAFKQRYQLYQAFVAGSLGYAYGHHSIWDFLTTGKTWQTALNDPGRVGLKPFLQLLAGLSDTQLMNRMPDQSLLDGSVGSAKTEDLLAAMRDTSSRVAVVYSTNGRDIRLNAAKLAAGTADAFWFSPRTGLYYNNAGTAIAGAFEAFPTGAGAPIKVFNPPGEAGADNDWVLKVVVR